MGSDIVKFRQQLRSDARTTSVDLHSELKMSKHDEKERKESEKVGTASWRFDGVGCPALRMSDFRV